jgi:hypothetical protein
MSSYEQNQRDTSASPTLGPSLGKDQEHRSDNIRRMDIKAAQRLKEWEWFPLPVVPEILFVLDFYLHLLR